MEEIAKRKYGEFSNIVEGIFSNNEYASIAQEAKTESSKLIKISPDNNIDIADASRKYSEIVNTKLIPFLNGIQLPKKVVEQEIDFQEVDDIDKTQTLFGMAPIAPKEEVKEAADNVLTTSYDVENTTMIPDISSVVLETPKEEVKEELEEVTEGEVEDLAKVKTLGKKAAYVDTVILCLIAQLSIFGLLILVLLIIK